MENDWASPVSPDDTNVRFEDCAHCGEKTDIPTAMTAEKTPSRPITAGQTPPETPPSFVVPPPSQAGSELADPTDAAQANYLTHQDTHNLALCLECRVAQKLKENPGAKSVNIKAPTHDLDSTKRALEEGRLKASEEERKKRRRHDSVADRAEKVCLDCGLMEESDAEEEFVEVTAVTEDGKSETKAWVKELGEMGADGEECRKQKKKEKRGFVEVLKDVKSEIF